MKSYWYYKNNKNTCFYHSFGLFAFLSQQYFLFLLQNRLFSKESSMSLSWFKMDWKTRWDKKKSFPSAQARGKKKRRENNARFSRKNSFLFLLKQKIKKKTTRSALSWPILLAYLFSYPLNWIVTGICSNCSKFSKITCPHTHAYFLYYQL